MKIGSAPVSFGIHGGADLTQLVASPDQLLDAIASAGYQGSELGPPGFFGSPTETVSSFTNRGLEVIAAYVPLHLSQPNAVLARDLEAMKRTLGELAETGNREVLAVLADEGDTDIIRHPFRAQGERGLNPAQWNVAIDRLNQADETARAAGVHTTFHPHFGTYVEQPGEIDTLLALSDINLCLDTGHFVLGGADPVEYFVKWSHRINHIHVKDVRLAVMYEARDHGQENLESWFSNVSCPLGEGDVPVEQFIRLVADSDYSGWIVVEQDGAPATAATWDSILADQRANRDWVAERSRPRP
ncbi:MAG: TIM barrel protein [Lacisediminihabitans sp.]